MDMASNRDTPMDIRTAARLLEEELREAPWLTMVGVGEHEGRESIFVYVKHVNPFASELARSGWRGFPVVIRKMGQPRPVPTSVTP